MADVVNDTHKSALSTRNQEPSHLQGGSRDDLGGPPLYGGGMDAYKIDAARGVGTDSSIPKAVGPEASHLKTEEADDDVDVSFDDDENFDDLDEALDNLEKFESVNPLNVDVDVKEEDEKDEDEMVKEEDDKDDKDNPFVKEEDEKDDDNPFVKEEDEKDEDDVVKEEDDKDDKDNPFVKEEDDKDDDDKKKNPFAESVKLRISLPKTNLFESVKISKKDQAKVGVVFESVVKATTKQISEQLHRHYRKLHEAKIAAYNDQLTKQIDTYLSYVVETWVKENRPVIRQSLRTQMSENFLNGLQALFKEHYIDVPESKVDVVKQLSEEVATLKSQLNDRTGQVMKFRKLAESINKARIVAEFARRNQLSEEQSNKLGTLVENVAYTNAKEFRQKLSMLKESYFAGAKDSKKSLPTLTEETIADPTPAKSGAVDADVAAVAATIDRSARSAGY